MSRTSSARLLTDEQTVRWIERRRTRRYANVLLGRAPVVESQSCLAELATCPCPTKRNAHEPLGKQGMCRSPPLHRHLARHLGEPSELAAERKECEVPKGVNVEPVTHERHPVGRCIARDGGKQTGTRSLECDRGAHWEFEELDSAGSGRGR